MVLYIELKDVLLADFEGPFKEAFNAAGKVDKFSSGTRKGAAQLKNISGITDFLDQTLAHLAD